MQYFGEYFKKGFVLWVNIKKKAPVFPLKSFCTASGKYRRGFIF